jgi:arylsulfatase A
MQRRDFLKGSAAGLAYLAASRSGWATPPATTPQPNILILLSDDQGYADLGCFGSPYLGTPNLDALAKQGVRFTDFYAAAPLCSPSRTGLMTGRIPSRCGMYSYIDDGDPTQHLPRQEVTIAQLLKAQGYDTCHLGKWHLSHLQNERSKSPAPLPQPSDFGFDYSFGTTNNALPTHLNPVNSVRNGKSVGPLKGYSCQLVADEGIEWLNARKGADRPFFMYLCFHESHETVAAPPERVAHYGQVKVAPKDPANERMAEQARKRQDTARTYLGCIVTAQPAPMRAG